MPLRALSVIGILALVLAVGVGAFAAGYRLSGSGVSRAAASSTAPEVTAPTVTSFDPVGGSGLRATGTGEAATWRTQTYASETFGNLKPGVGLVLDLGAARTLTSVEFDALTGPLTVELRSADVAPTSVEDMQTFGGTTSADGATTLDAGPGGSHRYWIVWITTLAPQDGGFGAELSTPVASG